MANLHIYMHICKYFIKNSNKIEYLIIHFIALIGSYRVASLH